VTPSWPEGRRRMRAALYVRVSTKEQTVENQERDLRAWAQRLGLEVVRVYADTASGARSDRAALAAVLAGAHRPGRPRAPETEGRRPLRGASLACGSNTINYIS